MDNSFFNYYEKFYNFLTLPRPTMFYLVMNILHEKNFKFFILFLFVLCGNHCPLYSLSNLHSHPYCLGFAELIQSFYSMMLYFLTISLFSFNNPRLTHITIPS